MPIQISDNFAPPPIAQAQTDTRKEVVTLLNNTFDYLREALRVGGNYFADNPYGLSLDDARAAFGDDIAEVDRLATLLKFTLERAVPGTVANAPADPPAPPTPIVVESLNKTV